MDSVDFVEAYHNWDRKIDALHNKDIKDLDIFFFPGNPGTFCVYIDFLNNLVNGIRARYRSVVHIHGVSHKNHHLEQSNSGNVGETLGLVDQILYQNSFVQQTLSDRESDVIFIGHSIGAFIALDIISRDQEIRSKISDIILLMPFIFWKNIPFYHRFGLKAYTAAHPISFKLVKSIGKAFINRKTTTKTSILNSLTKFDEDLVYLLVNQMLTKRLLVNFFSMGKDEIDMVPQWEDHMLELLRILSLEKSLCFLYTNNDVWAPQNDIDVLRHHLPDLPQENIIYVPDVTHAFSLNPVTAGSVCEPLLSYFENRLCPRSRL